MKALYVCLDPGVPVGGTKGAAIHVAEMQRGFAEIGVTTVTLARCVATPGAAEVVARPLAARLLPGGPLREIRHLAESGALRRLLTELIAEVRPDFVYERYALFRGEAVAAARAAGVPHVLEVNAPLAEEARRFRRSLLAGKAASVERATWRATDLVVVPSNPLAELVRAVRPEGALTIPNAVDPQRFTGADSHDRRSSLGLTDRYVVTFVGSPRPWHDLATVVDAVALLPESVAASLLLVGDGPERESVVRRAEQRGVHVVSVGAVQHEHVPSYLAASDICVVSLPADGALQYFSPLKAMEYLAAGRPTVVAMAGDLTAFVDAGVAVGYRSGDAHDLGLRLGELWADRSARRRLGAAAAQFATAHSWSSAAAKVLDAVTALPMHQVGVRRRPVSAP